MTLNVGRYLIILLLFSLSACRAFAQATSPRADTLISKINLYGEKNASPLLFVHFDKTIYTNNETVWFTGYILNCDSLEVKGHNVLLLTLLGNDDRKIAVQESFIIDGGLCFGNIILPDSLLSGNYNFVAYTDHLVNGAPQLLFKQPVTIKTTNAPAFDLTLTLTDSLLNNSGKISALLTAKSKNLLPLIDLPVNYTLGNAKHPLLSAVGKTGVNGEHRLIIGLPRNAAAGQVLQAEISNGKQKESVRLTIPARRQRASVKFYPEGGNLVLNKTSRVGWEVKGASGQPIKISAILYKNDKPADTIETDSYGMGMFKFTPQKNASYKVKILRAGVIDTTCALPIALDNGVVVDLGNAAAADSVSFKLQSATPQKFIVLVHNYKDVFYKFIMDVKQGGQVATLNLAALPRGLTMVTVLDSLQRPCAERVFFAHYDKRVPLNITTDKTEYTIRQKVKLNIKLGNVGGKLQTGLFSVACVQDSRMDTKKANNIENYYYLSRDIAGLPLKDNLLGANETDRKYIEELLLIRGWSRYTWTDMLQNKPADTLRKQQQELKYGGDVTYAAKPLKKPVILSAIGDSSIQIINTDNTGHFDIDVNTLLITPGKKLALILTGKAKTEAYAIHFSNPYNKITEALANSLTINDAEVTTTTEGNQALVLSGTDHVTNLREVKITSSKNDIVYPTVMKDSQLSTEANECGDYLCVNNILNCGYHRGVGGNHPPVKGDYIRVYRGGALKYEVYRGCVFFKEKEYSNVLKINGINIGQEFYGADYETVNPTTPDFQSTIYWKHTVPLNAAGEAELTFFTSDITGPFRVVVQGCTANDVAYAERTFMVKKK